MPKSDSRLVFSGDGLSAGHKWQSLTRESALAAVTQVCHRNGYVTGNSGVSGGGVRCVYVCVVCAVLSMPCALSGVTVVGLLSCEVCALCGSQSVLLSAIQCY